MQFFKARNPLKYHSRGEVWEQYKIVGRCQETADQRERRDFLNVAWQIFKELESGQFSDPPWMVITCQPSYKAGGVLGRFGAEQKYINFTHYSGGHATVKL